MVLLSSGCFVKRSTISTEDKINLSAEELLIAVNNNNISGGGFYIRKAIVNYSDQTDNFNFFVSIKHNETGQYLVVARTLTGIEVFRIFINSDTLLVNDRLNRRILTGNTEYLNYKYGVNYKSLALVLGDMISTESLKFNDAVCIDGMINFSNVLGDFKLHGIVDCNYQKMSIVSISSDNLLSRAEIAYSDYLNINNHTFPQKIMISSIEMKIIINIENIEFPWSGEVEFIPGDNYKIQLLK